MNEELKFKHLLEYFVCHLEYLENKQDKTVRGYDQYLKKRVDDNKFVKQGTGNDGERIQQQVKDWEQYGLGNLCVNINFNPQYRYENNGCYINWKKDDVNFTINIAALWSDNQIPEKKEQIFALQIVHYQNHHFFPLGLSKTVEELGLFDGTETVNEVLKSFFNHYKKEYLLKMIHAFKGKNNEYEQFLKQNYIPVLKQLSEGNGIIFDKKYEEKTDDFVKSWYTLPQGEEWNALVAKFIKDIMDRMGEEEGKQLRSNKN